MSDHKLRRYDILKMHQVVLVYCGMRNGHEVLEYIYSILEPNNKGPKITLSRGYKRLANNGGWGYPGILDDKDFEILERRNGIPATLEYIMEKYCKH